MKINKKYILATIGVLLLGSIWNRITEPFFDFSQNFFLNIISFGIKKYKDQIYLEVAKNFHENISSEIFLLFSTLLSSIILFMLLTIFLKKFFVKFNEKFKEHMLSDDKKIVKIIIFFYLIFAFGLLNSLILKTYFINRSIVRYNQLFNITAPYVTENERLIIQSEFGQIKSKNDYDEIIKSLIQTAKQNNIEVKNFEKN